MDIGKNTNRFGILLVLLGICSLAFLPNISFSPEAVCGGFFIPLGYILTGVCLLLDRSRTFTIRSMAALETLWMLLSLWLSLRLFRDPAQSMITGIPGFFSKILWLYYLIQALRFAVLALIGFYVPYAKKGALAGMVAYGVLAVSQLLPPLSFGLYLGYALVFRRLRKEEPAQGMSSAGAYPDPRADVIDTRGEVVQDHLNG